MKHTIKIGLFALLIASSSFAQTNKHATVTTSSTAAPVSSGVIAVTPATSQATSNAVNNTTATTPYSNLGRVNAPAMPMVTPAQPALNAKAYVIMDAPSGEILAAFNVDQRLAPASLTKMMTSYVISRAIKEGHIHLDDQVRISEKSWRTQGSKMFVRIGTTVPVRDLMQGIIVDSGNDACVAMAEYVAGSEDSFASLMNQEAARLGMTNTHFVDSTGLPNPNHYSTAHDMAILARALILDFPEDYQWYSQKWFTYNGIKQPNRNRLLWRDPSVDGVKTGHTDDAGFCLVASAKRNNTRIISVLMGAPSDSARADDSERLLDYGFRFFEVHKIYAANTILAQARVWHGAVKEIPVGVANDVYASVMPGQFAGVSANMQLHGLLSAPITEGQPVGEVTISLANKVIKTVPLVALKASPVGGIFTRATDSISLWFKHFFKSN